MIFYNQVVPGSVLMGYLNADHWAVAVPINRAHAMVASMFVTQNAYPREALLEAILRFVEEDLAATNGPAAEANQASLMTCAKQKQRRQVTRERR